MEAPSLPQPKTMVRFRISFVPRSIAPLRGEGNAEGNNNPIGGGGGNARDLVLPFFRRTVLGKGPFAKKNLKLSETHVTKAN